MPRYIDAEKINLPKGFFNTVDNVPKFYEWVETLPTADVQEVRHGKWEEVVIPSGYSNEVQYQSARCSVCKRYHTTPYLYTYYEHNYCPNCGAEMREGRENERVDS